MLVIIDADNNNLGEMSVGEAIAKSEALELDLVEVSPKSNPPVCRILDFGQFRFEQKKSAQTNKKNQKQTKVKNIKLSFRIGEHDMEVKEKQARKFIEAGHLVKIIMQFRGREMTHMDFGLDKIKQFVESLEDIIQVEQEAKRQGNQIGMLIAPKK
ncbi:translation initiation factor IF-3 [Candidatus Peregrinibacteria bacterium]|nr:translation initiation factor IF-3 [Candidatus Peregrinibacteria bacterium]